MRIVERSTPSMNSRARRDLPTPAAPKTVTRCTRLSLTTRANVLWSSSSSSSRPTSGTETIEPAADVLGDRDDAPGLDPVGEAARLLRAERRRDDDAAGEPLDGRAEHDLARLRRLLQAGRRVDREAGRERRLGLVREDLARLDPDPHLEAELADRRRRSPSAARTARSGSSSCANGHAERRHHGVAGELLDDAAVGRDAVRDLVEEPRQARADDLRIGARDELRRADEVDEEHRRELAFHP